MNKIAILGATGHIAKGIIFNFIQNNRATELALFARSIEKVKTFLAQIQCTDKINIFSYDVFSKGRYSAIINCVGFGNPNKLAAAGADIFEVTEKYDNLVIGYLKSAPETLYVNISSGSVYGDFSQPADENTVLNLIPNHISTNQYYGIAKLHSEVKHRAYSNLNIVDLRVFGYFSRFIDLDAGYLLSDITKSILNKTTLKTNYEDFVRDYINQDDLYQIIQRSMDNKMINCAMDVYSKKPLTKFEILQNLQEKFGLRYEIIKFNDHDSPTGIKSNYFSINKKAESIGYMPRYTSIAVIVEEMQRKIDNSRRDILNGFNTA